MVDSIGSSLPPSVQAVKNAQSNAQSQRSESASRSNPADQVSLSSEAQELGDIDRLASDTRAILSDNLDETLSTGTGSFEALL